MAAWAPAPRPGTGPVRVLMLPTVIVLGVTPGALDAAAHGRFDAAAPGAPLAPRAPAAVPDPPPFEPVLPPWPAPADPAAVPEASPPAAACDPSSAAPVARPPAR